MIITKEEKKIQHIGGAIYIPIPLHIWRAWDLSSKIKTILIESTPKGDMIVRKPEVKDGN